MICTVRCFGNSWQQLYVAQVASYWRSKANAEICTEVSATSFRRCYGQGCQFLMLKSDTENRTGTVESWAMPLRV